MASTRTGQAARAGHEVLEVVGGLLAHVVDEQERHAVVVGERLEPHGGGVGGHAVRVGAAHLGEGVDDDQPGVRVGVEPLAQQGLAAVRIVGHAVSSVSSDVARPPAASICRRRRCRRRPVSSSAQ